MRRFFRRPDVDRPDLYGPALGLPSARVAVAAVVAVLALVAPASALGEVDVTGDDLGQYQQGQLANRGQQLAVGNQNGDLTSCDVGTSTDGGGTWSWKHLIGSSGVFSRPSGYGQCLDPQVTFGPDGTLFYLYEVRKSSTETERRVYVTSSSDGGSTWATPRQINPNGVGGTQKYSDLWASMAVDPKSGRLYVGFMRYCTPTFPPDPGTANCAPNPLRLYVASSTDKGATFSTPVQAAPASAEPSRQSLAVDRANGDVYVAWSEGAGAPHPVDSTGTTFFPPNAQLRTARSTDQGQSWLPLAKAADVDGNSQACEQLRWTEHSRDHGFFHLLANGGKLYLARWDVDATAPNQGCRAFFQSSQNGGVSWSLPSAVGVVDAQHQQHRPRLALSPDGSRLDMVYWNVNASMQDTYRVSSANGGTSWTLPQRLSTVSSDLTVGPQGASSLANFGEWVGAGSTNTSGFASWTDSRETGQDGKNRQDVYSTSFTP